MRTGLVGHSNEAVHDGYDAAKMIEQTAAGTKIADYLAPQITGTQTGTLASEDLDRAANPLKNLELVIGIEPMTPSLRVTCSTS